MMDFIFKGLEETRLTDVVACFGTNDECSISFTTLTILNHNQIYEKNNPIPRKYINNTIYL